MVVAQIDKLLNQRISGLVFVNPNIPAQKYGRDMEIEAVSNSFEFMKGKRKGIKLSECGLFVDVALPYIVARPDKILSCSPIQ